MAIKFIIKQEIKTITEIAMSEQRKKLSFKLKVLNLKLSIGILAFRSKALSVANETMKIEAC